MKGVSALIAIIVLVLWLASATYIAAPASISNLLPSAHSSVPSAFIGVLLFLVSILLIVVWAMMTPEKAVSEEGKSSEVKQSN